MNVLITGTSRGIGFQLTADALAKGYSVIAVARKTEPLKNLQADYASKLTIVQADVGTPDGMKTIKAAAEKVGTLDILINNAGIYVKGETKEDLLQSFEVNAIAPFLLTKELLPFVQKSKSPRVIQISTMMASITDNTSGGSNAYRSSKTALNMLTRGLTLEFPKVSFQLIHPGWVKTEMGGDGATLEIADSAQGIWKVIDSSDLSNSGAYRNYLGEKLPW